MDINTTQKITKWKHVHVLVYRLFQA